MGKLRIVIADDNERMLQLLEDIIRMKSVMNSGIFILQKKTGELV